MVDSADLGLTARLERIRALTEALARAQRDSEAARQIASQIQVELDAQHAALQTLDTQSPRKR